MFDKRNLLQERLRPVIRTLQAVRFWRGTALILLVATLIAGALVPAVRSGRLSGTTAAWAILATVAAGIAIVAIAAGRSFLNLNDIAARIEQHFPSLGQRLLTAVQLPQPSQNASLSYLQKRVVEEAHDHSKTHRWVEVVSPKQILLSRLASAVSFVAMATTLWVLANSQPSEGAASRGQLGESGKAEVRIEPGNVQIERGTSLLVTARFDSPRAIDAQAELVCIAEDGSEHRLAMKPTLDDPVLSGFIASVDRALRYQVVSPRFQSEIYTAEVFDYPALTRSDAELDFPSYTALERKRIEDTVRVTAVEGTQLLWDLSVNKPVERATLIDSQGSRVVLQRSSDDPLRYLAPFEMTRSQSWRLELVDEAGRENKFPPKLVARVLPNEPPVLKLVAGGDAAVSPLEEFTVAAEVRDDFGIERFGLSYLFPGGKSAEIVLGQSVPRGQMQRGEQLIDFESLEAKPDQLLAYHFWAEDFAADGSIRRWQGDLHFAEVRPLEEIYRENESPDAGSPQAQQPGGGNGGQAEELAELQKQIINATWKVLRRELAPQRTAEFAGDLEAILQSQSNVIEQLSELGSQVSDQQSLEFVEQATASMNVSVEQLRRSATEAATEPLGEAVEAQQAAYQSLLGLRAREFQVSRSQQQGQQRGSGSSAQQRQQQIDQLELKNDENRYETQSQALKEETQQEGRQQREVIDRLRELAQRQEDINSQVAQLQSALELAADEETKREIERQLKRLRDQQQDMLRDADELAERMQQAKAQSRSQGQDTQAVQDAAEQLEQTRENIRQAGEALAQNDASEALAAGTRAERELDQMREELRQQAAGNFDEAMRQIRSAAQQLDERQQEIAQQMSSQPASDNQPGLRAEPPRSDVVEDLQTQRQRLGELLQQVQETIQQAESSEPLLAQNLYDTYRHTQQQKLDRKLSDTAELLRRGMQAPAEQLQQESGEAISDLRQRLEQAAESVLGDQTKALQRALGELEQLQRQLDREIQDATGSAPPGDRADAPAGQQRPSPAEQAAAQQRGEPNEESSQQPAGEQAGQPDDDPSGRPSNAQANQPSGQQPGQPSGQQPGQPSGQQPGQPGGQRPGQQQEQQSAQPPGQENGQPSGQENGQPPGPGARGGGAGGLIEQLAAGPDDSESAAGGQRGGVPGGGGERLPAPLSGEGYRQWSDRLRDVEQMIEDPAMRSEATRIRERAREARSEFRRHSRPPQWDEVEEMIARPLRELTQQVAQELLRRSADRHAVVPIDRDPVPDRFSEAVRRYYESLGSGL